MGVWDNDYEAVPSDLSVSDNGDDGIRSIKIETSLRMENEHNFKAGTTPYHKEGKCSVLFKGTTAEINALTGVPIGGVAYDNETKILKVYNGTAWISQIPAHSQLSGLSADDHTDYYNLTKIDQEIEESVGLEDLITVGGIDLSIDNAKIDSLLIKKSATLELDFDSAGKEIRRDDIDGSFLDDGLIVGDVIESYSTNNPGPFTLQTVTDTVLTVVEDVVDESDVFTSLFTPRKGFDDYSAAFNNDSTYGPELRDCIVWAITGDDTANAYLRGYSGNSAVSGANILRVACTRTSSRFGVMGVAAFPVRRSQYWKFTYALTYNSLLLPGLTIYRIRMSI